MGSWPILSVKVTVTIDQMLLSIQTEVERGRERERTRYQWVIRYYVILSHCNGNGTGNLGNGFPTNSWIYVVTLQGNLEI